VLIRITLFVFTPEYSFARLPFNHAMVWLAVIAIVMGSILALAQKSLKKMLVYIIVAEVGYMVGGLWLGNRASVTGAILHIVNDAAMTLCVFLAAGSILFKLKSDTFETLRGCFPRMPFTMAALAAGGLSIIGVPPTCGFFSKWYLITGALEAGQYEFVVALLLSSLINVVLFFRIFEVGYFKISTGRREYHGLPATRINEAPFSMVAMLLLASVSLIALGLISGNIVTNVILPAIPSAVF
jgi:multicomponent Na+:H+ antiporter subunit D